MTHQDPRTVIVPENRYDLLSEVSDTLTPTVVVVVPVYDGAERLGRVLDGIARQTRTPGEIVVADDGSDEDIAEVVERFIDLPIRYERQQHDGFGAGRARNLGVRSSTSDVILFVDGDCIPHTELVESHLKWHAKTANLVVVGNRYHVDESQLVGAVDDATLSALAKEIPDDGAPDDWRKLFYSKNRWLRTGDDAFRAFVTSNVSVTRSAFEAVDGFAEHFKAWGGEDTELGWRLWNRGATFAVEPEAIVYHLVGEDETREGRDEARRQQQIAFADVIPHPFYRPGGAGFYSVPRVSWIATVETADEMHHVWSGISRSAYQDTEVIAVGPEEALKPLSLIDSNDRVTVLIDGTTEKAVEAARGEFVVLIDGRVLVNPKFVSSSLKLAGSSPRVAHVSGAYVQEGAVTARSLTDIGAIDTAEGRGGLPLLGLFRRREIMKDVASGGGLDWVALVARSKEGLAFEASELAGVDTVIDEPSSLSIRDIKGAGTEQALRAVGSVARDRIGRR